MPVFIKRLGALLMLYSALCSSSLVMAAQRPNILLLVADDLGYSDISAFGSEIKTPSIDQLAAHGMVLRDFHATPSCSPTRAALLTGNDQHMAGLGLMAEVRKRSFVDQPVRAGYEGVLRKNSVTLPQLLHDAGYMTIISGKWHLGRTPELQPHNQGFEQSYVVLEGGSANFKQKEMGLFPNYPATFMHNGKPTELPDNFNSTVSYTDHLIQSIDAARHKQQPFFALAAYTAPHWPLQAPQAWLEKTRGNYDQGYQAIANQRLARMKSLGLLDRHASTVANLDAPDWASLSPEQQQREARKMEVYAAMVEQLDDQIGRLIQHLKETGQYDNTLIVFMSDNGPEAKNYDQVLADWVAGNFDNSLDNLGHRNSFVTYGKAWAAVSAQPLRGSKQSVLEGSTRVPAIISFAGKIRPGDRQDLINVRDLMPTLLQYAGVDVPGIEYAGRAVYPLQGESLVALLSDPALGTLQGAQSVIGWEVDGTAAVRLGSMKLVYAPVAGANHWQLYDLASDKGEQRDIATANPPLVARMKEHWRHYAQVNNIALNPDLSPATPTLSKD